MATTRAAQLQQLAQQLPVANQEVASGLDAARQVQMQQAIQQAAPTSDITKAAQQGGAQQAQQAGQIQLQQAAQTKAQMTSLGQQGLQAAGRAQRAEAQSQAINETALQRKLGEKLFILDRNVKKEVLDNQLQFKMDESGRAIMNERQVADWAISNSKSAEDFADKVQAMQLAYDKEIAIMDMAQKKLEQTIRLGHREDMQKLDQESIKELQAHSNALKIQTEKKMSDKKNLMSMIDAGGKILFGAAGAATSLIPGMQAIAPGLAVMGASQGGEIATSIASAFGVGDK